jgi:hypothetical protein
VTGRSCCRTNPAQRKGEVRALDGSSGIAVNALYTRTLKPPKPANASTAKTAARQSFCQCEQGWPIITNTESAGLIIRPVSVRVRLGHNVCAGKMRFAAGRRWCRFRIWLQFAARGRRMFATYRQSGSWDWESRMGARSVPLRAGGRRGRSGSGQVARILDRHDRGAAWTTWSRSPALRSGSEEKRRRILCSRSPFLSNATACPLGRR